jgi:hypothetical protein
VHQIVHPRSVRPLRAARGGLWTTAVPPQNLPTGAFELHWCAANAPVGR